MKRNNFVSRLTEEDFFEFISSIYDTKGFKVSDLSIIKLPICDKDDPPKLKVVLKSRKKFGKLIPEPMTFYFYKFNYEKDIMLSIWDARFVISSINEPWRAFMTKKFGNEYVEDYRNYVSMYIQNETQRLESLNSECNSEIERLRSITRKLD